MKIRVLEKRLRKAESVLRCEPDLFGDIMYALLWFAIAYYLGKPSRNEKPFAAYARALGYASESELNTALENNDRNLWKRVLSAEIEVFAKFDYRSDGPELGEVLGRMQAGLPKSYVDQFTRVVREAKISVAWLHDESNIASYIRFFA
jgi:hypothetical protein